MQLQMAVTTLSCLRARTRRLVSGLREQVVRVIGVDESDARAGVNAIRLLAGAARCGVRTFACMPFPVDVSQRRECGPTWESTCTGSARWFPNRAHNRPSSALRAIPESARSRVSLPCSQRVARSRRCASLPSRRSRHRVRTISLGRARRSSPPVIADPAQRDAASWHRQRRLAPARCQLLGPPLR